MDFVTSVAASLVAAVVIYVAQRWPKPSLRRPSIWSAWGRFLLSAECWLRHPISMEKRADLQFSRGWDSAGDVYGGGYGGGRA